MNIWSDPWIPSSPDRKVITPRGQTILTRVCELIDPTSGTWDETLISNLFNPVDVRRILQILIYLHHFDDFIAWNPSRVRIFLFEGCMQTCWRARVGLPL